MILKNFHTHTYRCKHAIGIEREYVEGAIKAGIKTLGFSDHAPYCFGNTKYYSGMRIEPSDAENYVKQVLSLKKEYEKDIEIYLGFEAEYFPKFFDEFIAFIKPFNVDYLILGQHFTDNEYDGMYVYSYRTSEKELVKYVNQVISGLNTGYFSYVAHPDLIIYKEDKSIYTREMGRLCKEAKRLNIPLEFNLLGYIEKRQYPREEFFEIAKEYDNTIIFGCDAHEPDFFKTCQKYYESALNFINRFGLKVTENIKILNGKTI